MTENGTQSIHLTLYPVYYQTKEILQPRVVRYSSHYGYNSRTSRKKSGNFKLYWIFYFVRRSLTIDVVVKKMIYS